MTTWDNLPQEVQSDIGALRQRAVNFAKQLSAGFNIVHPGMELRFDIQAYLVIDKSEVRPPDKEAKS